MLIVCPNCKKRFNITVSSSDEPKKLRCSSCKAVFRLVRKSERPAAPQGKVKVVVANESAAFCKAVEKVLAAEPFELFLCTDGKEALETVQRVQPNVLLLDVALPTMFGFEVCERVRQDPALAKVKIVLIASIYDKTRYKRSPNSLYGADDYIEKHHIPDSLVSMVYRLTSGDIPPVVRPTESELAAQEESRSEIRQMEVEETSMPQAAAAPAPEPPVAAPPAAPVMTAAETPAPVMAAAETPAPVVTAPDAFVADVVEPPVVAAPEAPVAVPELPIVAAPEPPAAPAVEAPAAAVAAPSAPAAPAAPAQAAQAQLPEEQVKARRLARIIVSDIVLYNQAKVEQGVREGNFYEVLADDIREGEYLYQQRVSQQVRDTTSFLKDAFEELIAKKRAELSI
ncbi:zinc-ribbon domain-containing protein [Geomonas oryzisoli]|uniref:Zinc-ribbon domain-containing protein n=1 Tax=Geomonas oryzisoli TaxID=2847992 RepID=A0ABX8JAM0_9BACT|nr:response regulator [Geomonas oryzisoli]QWV94181.1 zinc-ribbon domain-containing protein [Geomonas oryzisoli]